MTSSPPALVRIPSQEPGRRLRRASTGYSYPGSPDPKRCTKPRGVERIVFSNSQYPNIHKHFRGALRRDRPRRLVLNGPAPMNAATGCSTASRRATATTATDTRPQSCAARARAWSAAAACAAGRPRPVRRNSENRSHGASLGNQLAASAPARGSGTSSGSGGSPRRLQRVPPIRITAHLEPIRTDHAIEVARQRSSRVLTRD